jgi:hypothetical protein
MIATLTPTTACTDGDHRQIHPTLTRLPSRSCDSPPPSIASFRPIADHGHTSHLPDWPLGGTATLRTKDGADMTSATPHHTIPRLSAAQRHRGAGGLCRPRTASEAPTRPGLLQPARTDGGTRRYSADDLDRLRRIGDLLDAGLNLAGIGMVLDLQEQNTVLEDQNNLLEDQNTRLRADRRRRRLSTPR